MLKSGLRTKMKEIFNNIKKYLPFIVIGVFFFWSLISVCMRRLEENPPGAKVIRLSHWQLEPDFQTAIDVLAKKYQKLHPDVKIIQEAIPETSYGQWCSTQLMGGTGPDLMEMGKGLPYHIWISYYNRYMVPLTQYVDKPNPYNKDNELADVPFRNTFRDGMRVGYIEELQEYMQVPMTQLSVRLFYNKTLLKKLTGLDEGPTNYRQFLDVCKKIKAHKDPTGKNYIPIAGSKFHVGMWNAKMFYPMSYSLLRYADFNRDGYLTNYEQYVAFKTGELKMNNPEYKAMFGIMREVLDNFQPGYIGLNRDEAVFTFAQERAVFIATGTWDSKGLKLQAEGVFELGVMDFPWPDQDDPVYGKFVKGPVYEKPITCVSFAVNRDGKHPDVALDFLLFMASKENNETLNKIIGWTPCIIGAETEDYLAAFKPKLRGIYPAWNPNLGGESWIRWLQLESLYKVDQISYENLCKEFEPFYIENGYKDYLEMKKDWRRGLNKNERFLCNVRVKALTADKENALSRWVKYRSLVAARQVWPEVNQKRQFKMVKDGPDEDMVKPYIYSDKLIEKVKRNLRKNMETR